MQLDTSNSVCRLIEANPSLVQKVIPEKGRGQGHVTNFYILYLKVSPQEVIGVLVQSTNLSTVSLWIIYEGPWLDSQVYYMRWSTVTL